MTIRTAKYTITGNSPLLLNNPQTVDRFNVYAKRMSQINAKKTRRTDADYLELRDLEIRSKIYWDDGDGIYVPSRWILAALAKMSHGVVKISKANLRGTVFAVEDKLPLNYRNKSRVKSPEDIIKQDEFRHVMLLPQGGVRIAKATPIFHDWSFSGTLEYDDTQIDPESLERLLQHVSKYGGFGDFRPTFGRATAEVTHV